MTKESHRNEKVNTPANVESEMTDKCFIFSVYWVSSAGKFLCKSGRSCAFVI
jgi:hypothetical protein